MNALTDYRKPRPKFGLAALQASRWTARTGWELSDGVWRRWYRKEGCAGRHRLARVCRARGGWSWSVCERDTRLRWREIQRGLAGAEHYTAQGAWPFAELAARQP